MRRLTYSAADAAAALGVSKATVYGAVRDGSLPHIRLLGRILIPKAAVAQMLEGGNSGSAVA